MLADYAGRVVTTPGLEGYWRLGEVSGLTRMACCAPDGLWGSRLDVKCSASGPEGRPSFSFEAWVKPGHLDENTRRIIDAAYYTYQTEITSSAGYFSGIILGARASGLTFSRYQEAATITGWDPRRRREVPRTPTRPRPTP